MRINLTKKKCIPCEGGLKPLNKKLVKQFMTQLRFWQLKNNVLTLELKFKNFKKAMEFTNKIAKLAEQENHHPDIYIFYNKVKLNLSTHAIKGLSQNDFILASKIEKILS